MKLENLIPEGEFKDNNKKSIEFSLVTRLLSEITGDCAFFFLKPIKADFKKTVKEIIKRSPKAIVCEDKTVFGNTKIPIIEVKNARRAYAYAMSNSCGISYDGITFIGITGTNGKTSTATMLKTIFEYAKYKVGFIGTGKIISDNVSLSGSNYSMTCPDPEILYPSIARMKSDGCKIIIMEVSSHALSLEKTAPIPFWGAAFTGLSPEHLDFHGDMENYFLEKEKLIAKCDFAVINYDDAYGKRLCQKYKEKVIPCGVIWQSTVSATDVENFGLDGIEYILKSNFLTKITLSVPGIYNVYNSMLAVSLCTRYGIAPCVCKKALSTLTHIDGRCEIIRDDITVVIDYAHTPFALKNLLKTVKVNKISGQKITLVFGCGGDRDTSKRPEMAKIAEYFCENVIVTSDNPRSESPQKIINDIVAGFTKNSYGVISDRRSAITYAIKSAFYGDIVIIAGKGHEKYTCDKAGYHYFDEREIIDKALKERKGEC